LQNRTLSFIFAALSICCSLGASTTSFVTGSGAAIGSERCLSGASQNGGTCDTTGSYSGLTSMVQLFADSQGATLTRVDDATDIMWRVDAANAGVFAIGRSAGRAFSLDIIPDSSPGSLISVLPAFASNAFYLPSIPAGQNANGDLSVLAGKYNSSNRPASFTSVTQTGAFQFILQEESGTDRWSSSTAKNSDHLDHMVTWRLSNSYLTSHGLVWYIAGFENAVSPGSDRDFNDYVFLFQNVSPEAPEPAPFTLIACGLIALGVARRRHAYSGHVSRSSLTLSAR
jgi:hypothetical protein